MAIALNGEYQALARKYRPQTFADVVGQKHVLGALANAIDTKRIHHAYLLTGTRGIGKTTIARIIAKSLECEQGISSHPCGQCAACQGIAHGSYPDVIEIDAASQTKVDDTRQLLENTQYPPVTGRYKIYIIDEVHMLSQSSFNALLKTLEEPPAYVKFILATTDPHKIPTTVLSRCLQFQLKALSVEEISAQIMKIAAAEQLSCEPEAALLLARAAKGSMRDALSLTDQAVALGGGAVRRDTVLSMLGAAGDNLVLAVLESLLPDTAADLGKLLGDIAEVSPNYRTLLDEMTLALHDLALFQFIGSSRLNVFSLPLNLLEQYAPRFSAQELQLYYQICLEGLREYDFAPDGKAAFEMTVLRLHAFNPEKKKAWLGEEQAAEIAYQPSTSDPAFTKPLTQAQTPTAEAGDFNYAQPLNLDAVIAQVKSLTAPSLPGAQSAPAAAAAPVSAVPVPDPAVPANEQISAQVQERFEQSLELLHYLGQLRRTMQELLHQALQRPEKGGRSANELHAIVSDISSKNAVQAAALPQQSMPSTQPEMPAAEPAGEPQPPAELTAEYRNQMQAQAQHLSAQAAAPEKAQPALSAAELTAIEQSGQNLSLEQVQQLNAAVDQSLSQDDYQSPLAANFAPDPAPDARQAEPAAAAPAPQPVPQPAPAPVPQPVPQPPADDLPPMPEEFADLPPVEAEIAPEAGDDDDDDDAYLALQEQSADALLFAKAPEAPPQYQTAPHTQAALPPRAECKARLQEPKFRPVTQLPHGSSAPQFAGFKLVTPEDFYPQLPSLSPWYAVLAQLKLKNGPERSALMYADLVQDPGSGSELELNMSAEYQQYFAGSKAKPIIEQALSEYYGRPMTLKLNFTAGAPERAPAELARKALSLEGVKKREELKREPQLMALAAALQENLDDVPLVLYRRDDT